MCVCVRAREVGGGGGGGRKRECLVSCSQRTLAHPFYLADLLTDVSSYTVGACAYCVWGWGKRHTKTTDRCLSSSVL